VVDPVRLARLLQRLGEQLSILEERAAEDSSDAVRLLARHAVIDPDVAEQLARATGFRNVLVHGYADVDDDVVVVDSLDDLGDMRAFIDQVRSWVARSSSSAT
jgi:uncharacterized protein YutE (UPF0331/DUF86 family)